MARRTRLVPLLPLALALTLGAGLPAPSVARADEARAGGDARPDAVLDALLPEGRRHVSLEALVERMALEEGEARRAELLGRDETSSHHLLAMRGGEEPHRHERHALLVVVLRGHGAMRLGESTREVGPGSVIYVPPGAVHAFTNRAERPAVAYAVYTPPFEGEDRVPAPGEDER